MDNIEFDRLLQQIQRLNQKGLYSDALELIDREIPHYKDQEAYLRFWQVNLAAHLDKQQALHLLEESLNAGLWFSETVLRRSPPLKSLQSDPDFERLVTRSRSIQNQAELEDPALVIVEPEPANGNAQLDGTPLLLALHNRMSHPGDCLEFWQPAVSAGWLLAAPRAPRPFWSGAYVWEPRESALGEIQDRLSELQIRYRIDPNRLVLGGRQLGGHLAMSLALTGEVDACGFILVNPVLSELEQWIPNDIPERDIPLRGFLVLSEESVEGSHEPLLQLVKTLNAHHIPFELELHSSLGEAANLEHALEYLSGG